MTEPTTQAVPTTADVFERFLGEAEVPVPHEDVHDVLRQAIQASLGVHHWPLPDDVDEATRRFHPAEELMDRLRQRYEHEETPPCRVCGEALSVQSMGGGNATKFAHSKPEGVTYGDWMEHYQQSTWTQRRSGDGEVLALVEIVQSLIDGPSS